jgi:hypothetical protein
MGRSEIKKNRTKINGIERKRKINEIKAGSLHQY